MNFKRKMDRAKMPKEPRHCGQPMLYKESYGDWICEKCGKIKHKPKGADGGTDRTADGIRGGDAQ